MKIHLVGSKIWQGLAVLLVALPWLSANSEFVTRDKRWPTRGPWMWELPRQLPNLYWEFNGIDFGHAHVGETLLKTQDQAEVERARLEVLDFIFSAPKVPPDEEQVAPTLVRMIWEVQRSFNWTHSLHRSLYDLFAADDVKDKETAYHTILGDYLSKPEAITFHPLDHHGKMWSWPESKAFRDKFRKFNTQIWAYHWLQAGTYDVQLTGNAARQRELMPKIIEHYHSYLRNPPIEWQVMPMMMEASPEFSMRFKEAADIFDNLHMLHDNVDDVLSRPDLYPTHEARREQILKILAIYLHRNHAGHDRYAEYHGSMEGGMGGAMQQHGNQHGAAKATTTTGGGQEHQHEGKTKKGAPTKPAHEPLKDEIPPGKEHAAAGHGKEGHKDTSSSEHGGHGAKKPEHADWQKRAGQKMKQGQAMQGGGHDDKDMQGMKGMSGQGHMMQGMKGMGPRPPSAKDVLEGKTGNKNVEGGNKQEKGHEHGGSGAPPGDVGHHSGGSMKLSEATEFPDLANRRSSLKTGINSKNVQTLRLAWTLPMEHYVTHTPLLHSSLLYFTDWAGHAYAADAATGKVVWKKKLYDPEMKWAWHGLAGTGVIAEGLLIEASVEGDAYGIDLNTGAVKWKANFSPENKYGGSFNKLMFHDGLVYIGVSSVEEHIAEEQPKYKPTFCGAIVALDARNGKIAWRRAVVEPPGNGVGVWTTFALDRETGTLFATTGNNYTGEPNKLSDAILALDAKTGEIRWSRQVTERDVWTPAEPKGPDFDFAGGPQLFEAGGRKLVGAAQKSGMYWAFDRSNGEIVWRTFVSYGGVTGGMHSDASVGDGVIYCWGNNAFDHGIDPADSAMNVAALDAETGKVLWKKDKSQQSALTTAGFLSQDVYLVPCLDGRIHAYRASDGEKLWQSPEVPGPLSSSLAVSGEAIFCTSGMPKKFSYYEGENGVHAYALGGSEGQPSQRQQTGRKQQH